MQEPGTARVLHAHTGADWERGRTQQRNGEQIAGREHNRRLRRHPQPEDWHSGRQNYADEAGRRRRLKDTPAQKTVTIRGKEMVIFKGAHPSEDERWVVITQPGE